MKAQLDMNKVLRALIAVGLFAILGVSGLAFADQASDFVSQRVQQLKSQLGLSDDQVSKIQGIMQNAMPPANQTPPTTPTDRQAFFQAQRTKWSQAQNDINSVLNDQQKQQYQQFLAQRYNRGGYGGNSPDGNSNWQGQNGNQWGGHHHRHHRMYNNSDNNGDGDYDHDGDSR